MSDRDPNEPGATELEIADILDAFRQELHDGDNPDPDHCLGSHPHLAEELADCLQGLAAIEELRQDLQRTDWPTPLSPQSLGDFQIVREIGRGGMGIVYEAVHTGLNRRVAVKVIKAGALADGRELELFRKEALAAASLHHANIVQIFEFGNQDGQPYLVLEFVDGGSLDDRLAGTPIDPYEAAPLITTLAKAIHYAHVRGIIHRDLKPANVLLMLHAEFDSSSAGQVNNASHFANPKVADFGLAKHLHANDGPTQSGAIQGTPSYMAPEQATGGPTSSATDVYALGAILYETLTGRPPFRAATPLDTLLQVTSMEPVPPTRLQPSMPRDLETICLKCLHKEPGQRYRSAQELADELERFMRHEPIHARPVGVGGRMWRWCRRNPVVASLLGVAAALALLVAVLLMLRLVDERSARERVLAENVFAANHLANTILVELLQAAEAVDQVANDPEVLRLLKKDRARLVALPPDPNPSRPRFSLPEDDRSLRSYMEKVHKNSRFAFHSWHIEDKDAIMLADVPRPSKSVFGVCFQGRDYFVGAKRHVGTVGRARVHVSRAYQSMNDGLFKITLSAAIYDGDQETLAGVVCATLPTDASLGSLELTDPEHTAVLIGQVDTNHPNLAPPNEVVPSDYMVLVHPAYRELKEVGRGKNAIRMPQSMLPLVPRRRPGDEFVPTTRTFVDAAKARHDAFEDPLGAVLPDKYGGRWLAGFAQVGNTEMVVIVQRRRREWADLPYWPFLAFGGILAGALTFIAMRSLRTERGGGSKPAESAATIAYADPPAVES